jgi:hypothetical protein
MRGRGPETMMPGETPEQFRQRAAYIAPTDGPQAAPGQSVEQLHRQNVRFLDDRDVGPNSDLEQRKRDAVIKPWADAYKEGGIPGVLMKPAVDQAKDVWRFGKQAATSAAVLGQERSEKVRAELGMTPAPAAAPAPAPAAAGKMGPHGDDDFRRNRRLRMAMTNEREEAPAVPGSRIRSLAEARQIAEARSSGNPADNAARHDKNLTLMRATQGRLASTRTLEGKARTFENEQAAAAGAQREASSLDQANQNRDLAREVAGNSFRAAVLGNQAQQKAAAEKAAADRAGAFQDKAAELLLTGGTTPVDKKGRPLTDRQGRGLDPVRFDLATPEGTAAFNQQLAALGMIFGQGAGGAPGAQVEMAPEQEDAIAQRVAAMTPAEQAEALKDPRARAALERWTKRTANPAA